MPFNLPIFLTWLRILAIPLLIGLYYLPPEILTPRHIDLTATILFIAAALTDWADGYLARRFNQVSSFGAFLDPVADKLMVAAALIMLVSLGRAPTLVALIIIGREIAISALREWMAKIGAAKSIAVSMLGKVKTTAQMVAIPMLLYHGSLWGIDMHRLGTLLIWVAALLTLWSMVYYLQKARQEVLKHGIDLSR